MTIVVVEKNWGSFVRVATRLRGVPVAFAAGAVNDQYWWPTKDPIPKWYPQHDWPAMLRKR